MHPEYLPLSQIYHTTLNELCVALTSKWITTNALGDTNGVLSFITIEEQLQYKRGCYFFSE